ncbi:alpha/beta hydrolase [Sphingobium sp. H39-3-25]|uniref:alpha/beta hydrolase n=1 Tax=Sphingobium arseniciresistens TaxID=3030834 RepID=UPI0023B9FD86|nr:alpha/beta hydrolase [Sphingobium arseniciresistens]
MTAPATDAPLALSIILVHGAFVDASGWQAVFTDLVARGFEVLVTQHPTVTLEGDVAVVRDAIAAARNPVVLVGHSYGGAIITAAGTDSNVAGLAYVAAFVPDAGESVGMLAAAPLEAEETPAPVIPAREGFLLVDPVGFAQAFAADVDPAITRFLAAAQQHWGLGAVDAPVTEPAWASKPAACLVATADRMIPLRAQRLMAARAGAPVTEVEASHAVMLSQPGAVAAFIAATAAAIASAMTAPAA